MVPFNLCTKHIQIIIRRLWDHCLGRWVELNPNLRILTVQFSSYFQCVCTSFLTQNLVGAANYGGAGPLISAGPLIPEPGNAKLLLGDPFATVWQTGPLGLVKYFFWWGKWFVGLVIHLAFGIWCSRADQPQHFSIREQLQTSTSQLPSISCLSSAHRSLNIQLGILIF